MRQSHRSTASGRRAFSLIELLVVLAVTLVLTGLLLPALSQVRENVKRVFCASNQRQLGLGIHMYARDNDDELPRSNLLSIFASPEELTTAWIGESVEEQSGEWDGIGRLFEHSYCAAPECYYCPSHLGSHRFERYEFEWPSPGYERIYTNYHYAGHVDWSDSKRKRSLQEGEQLALTTDGFSASAELNHQDGMNVLRADGSVRWRGNDRLFKYLAQLEESNSPGGFHGLWRQIESISQE